MNGGDGWTWPHQWQKEMRPMQQISLVTAENSRQLKLFVKRIVLQRGAKFFCVRRMNQLLALGRQNEQILVFRSLCGNGFGQALHVPADAQVADSAQVKSNFHAAPKTKQPGRSGALLFRQADSPARRRRSHESWRGAGLQ